MEYLDIKPLSVNQAYTGRRFATEDLKKYREDLSIILPKIKIPDGNLAVKYVFGISKGSDGDNCVKAFQDIIADQYGFNDNRIYHWDITKVLVNKGKEFIEFEISTVDV